MGTSTFAAEPKGWSIRWGVRGGGGRDSTAVAGSVRRSRGASGASHLPAWCRRVGPGRSREAGARGSGASGLSSWSAAAAERRSVAEAAKAHWRSRVPRSDGDDVGAVEVVRASIAASAGSHVSTYRDLAALTVGPGA